MRSGFFILSLTALFVGCLQKKSPNGEPLARVGNHFLYISDINSALAGRSPLQDSVPYLKKLVQEWVREQVLLDKANKVLTAAQKDKRKELDAYLTALLVYDYQRQMVEQKLDTMVTDTQIKQYFEKNKADFELKQNLIRFRYVKLKKNMPADEAKTLIGSDKEEDLKRLKLFCRQHASNYFLNDKVWLSFQDVLKEIPIQTYNEEDFLKNNTMVEVKDNEYTYLVRISDYRVKNGQSQPELEHDRIVQMIVQARKAKLIRESEQQVLKEAELNGSIEIF
jgi:hypothetical protein